MKSITSDNPAYPLTITASAMRDINRSAVLEIIRRLSPISRSTISERLNVSLPTVMRIVDDLIEEGLVRAHGESEWSGGRRRALIEYNASGFVVLGVDLGDTKMYGALSDLGGNVIAELNLGRHGTSGENGYQRLVELIDTLLSSPALEGRKVRGIGVGAPGITLHQEGIVKWAAPLEWQDFPLKSRLSARYNLPITVDNDVNLAAMGELWFGVGQNTRNMVVVSIGAGIGAGIIIDGALYRGSNEASGEIGSMLPGREFLGKDFSEFGALETMASGIGITERAKEVLKSQRDPSTLTNLWAGDVFLAARQGQDWARIIVDETVDYLAVAVANLAVSFDPEMIVLGGSVTHAADLFIEPILQRLQGCIPLIPELVVSTLGRRAVAMGAITNILYSTSDYYVVRKMS
jgi:predicted NBD/HSP70 family sugar kinase